MSLKPLLLVFFVVLPPATRETAQEHAGVPCREVKSASFASFDDGIYQPGILTRPVK